MGEIFIRGFGRVQIAGETATPEEEALIFKNMQDAGLGPEEDAGVETIPVDIPDPIMPKTTPEGRSGLISRETRGSIRSAVERLPAMQKLAAEMTPAVLGTVAGAAVGALGGPAAPLTVLALGMFGGFLGEWWAQEAGVTPNSEMALILSTAGPGVGVAIGGAAKVGRLALGGGLSKIPPLAAALGRKAQVKAASAADSLGGWIISRQRGLQKLDVEDIYTQARKVRVPIETKNLTESAKTLGALKAELETTAAMPESAQALAFVNQSLEVLLGNAPLDFNKLITIRQLIGNFVAKAEKFGGIKLGSAKQVYKAMADDVDRMARSYKPPRHGAKLVVAAFKRAKLEFAIKDFEAATVRFSRNVEGKDDIILDVDGLRKWLFDVTTKKSEVFNANLTEALRKQLPHIKNTLRELSKATKGKGSAAGAGSIVVRGGLAKLGRVFIGGMIGLGSAGPLGAAIGGLAGASGPEMITALFMTRPMAALLARTVKLGKGEISLQRWAVLTQALIQASRVEDDPESPKSLKRPFTLTPLEARRRIQEQIGEALKDDPLDDLESLPPPIR